MQAMGTPSTEAPRPGHHWTAPGRSRQLVLKLNVQKGGAGAARPDRTEQCSLKVTQHTMHMEF